MHGGKNVKMYLSSYWLLRLIRALSLMFIFLNWKDEQLFL